VAWLDPLDELDELGVLDGDWSWPLLDVLELLLEPEVELLFEPLELFFELEDELPVWPA
jgi:hypothetical protein